MRRIVMLCLLLAVISLAALPVSAERTAVQLDEIAVLDQEGFEDPAVFFDGDIYTGFDSEEDAQLTLHHPDGIGSFYLIFDRVYGGFTIEAPDLDAAYEIEAEDYYHRFVDVAALFGKCPQTVTLHFAQPACISEIYAFSSGQAPDWVQRWQAPPEGNADLVLFSTHGDDEQLFFAGLLPYYAGELGYNVEVVYLTDHRQVVSHRVHEMLNGLWAVGVRHYPVLGDHPDFRLDFDLEENYRLFAEQGYSKEYLLGYVVENLRRFKPTVAVGHDVNGEYGHGMHMMYSDLLMQASAISGDIDAYPESAEQYGAWDVPKTYLHLYSKDTVVMNWDTPLSAFDGRTAYEVSRDLGFPCHESQYRYYTWYYEGYPRALDVMEYNPCFFGLYRSTVGADEKGSDFFENVVTYTQAQRLAEEERIRQEQLEQQRLEEAARLERERKEQEAERQRQEEQARLERERLEAEALLRAEQRQRILAIAGVSAGVLLLLGIGISVAVILRRKKQLLEK